jgi:hypothetical protein
MYLISAGMDGRPDLFRRDVELKSGDNTLNLTMEQGATIKGRLVNATTGQQIALPDNERDRVRVSIHDHQNHVEKVGKVERDGTFTLLVPEGRSYLGIHLGPKWSSYNSSLKEAFTVQGVVVENGQTVELEVRLTPKAEAVKDGRAKDIPVESPRPTAPSATAPVEPRAPSAGQHGESGKMPLVQVAAADAAAPQVTKITLSGVCLDEYKKPVADARVRLFRIDYADTPIAIDQMRVRIRGSLPGVKGSQYQEQTEVGANSWFYDPKSQRVLAETRSGADGKFQFENVSFDKAVLDKRDLIQVVAQAPGRATYTADARWLLTASWSYSSWPNVSDEEKRQAVQQGAKKEAELTLLKAATLRGRILDEDHKPIAGAVVFGPQSLYSPLPGINCALTDAQGRYEIADLAPFDIANVPINPPRQIADREVAVHHRPLRGVGVGVVAPDEPALPHAPSSPATISGSSLPPGI